MLTEEDLNIKGGIYDCKVRLDIDPLLQKGNYMLVPQSMSQIMGIFKNF
jgi:hypothetical protein